MVFYLEPWSGIQDMQKICLTVVQLLRGAIITYFFLLYLASKLSRIRAANLYVHLFKPFHW